MRRSIGIDPHRVLTAGGEALSPPHGVSRSLLPRHVNMIAVGGTIGAGLFVSTGTAIAAAGPAILVSYLLTGGLVLLVMRMLAKMALRLPAIHGFPEFPRVVLGHWAGFVSGWLYWYFWMMVVPVEAIAGANILHLWWPVSVGWLGLALVSLVLALNLLSVKAYGEVEFWFAATKVVCLGAFMVAGTVYLVCTTRFPTQTFANMTAHGGFAPHGGLAILAGSVTAFFSLVGTEITTIAAAESVDPPHAVARNGALLVVRILGFYLLCLALILCIAPWSENRPGFSPFTLALRTMHESGAADAMGVIVLIAAISTLNSAFFVCSRVLRTLATYTDAPGWLATVSDRRVPARSALTCALAGFIGVTVAIQAPSTVFVFLVNASSALLVFVYGLVTVAYIKYSRASHAQVSEARALKTGTPWSGYIAFTGLIGILLAMALSPSLQRDLAVSVVILLVLVCGYRLWSPARLASPARVE